MPFDFVLLKDNQPKITIEYHGEQHFSKRQKSLFGGIEKQKLQQIRDKIKEKYCEDNNIPLLIIIYKEEKNIENILNNFISRHFNV